MNLQKEIDDLYINKNKKTIEEYNKLLLECANKYEMAAMVFIYDNLVKNHKPNEESFNIINKLHSKTVSENKKIVLKETNKKTLSARRRIHKIIKGHNYTKRYKQAKTHVNKVKVFLEKNKNLKDKSRIKLANILKTECNISFEDARYIITSLKREGYLVSNKNKIDCNTCKLDKYFLVETVS